MHAVVERACLVREVPEAVLHAEFYDFKQRIEEEVEEIRGRIESI